VIVALPTTELRDAVGPVDGVEYVLWDGSGDPPRADEVEVCVPDYRSTVRAMQELGRMPALRVVQTQLAGYDGQLELLPDGVVLANASGVHDDATAEHAVGLAIAVLRGIPEAVRSHGHWTNLWDRRSLADSRVMVLGYGSIGRAVAERLLPMRAHITAVASGPRQDPVAGRVHGVDELPGLLGEQDVVIVLLPLGDSTRGFVGDDVLAALPDGAVVVNVARGAVLDTEAVLRHAGRLRFALDVTDPEPLPDGHALWSAPGVLITPHVAGGTSAMLPRMAALLRDQLERLVAGRPLRNVVS
jgi:phosphoglycerate dehydrogenase-like enzyme